MMTITKSTMTYMGYGTKRFAVEGTDLNKEDLEDHFLHEGPFGTSARVYNNGTTAEVTCYYD